MARFFHLFVCVFVLRSLNAAAQVTMSVTFPGGPCVPTPVQFNNTSGGTVLNWTVTTPGSGTADLGNSDPAIYTYGEAGTYTATLTTTLGTVSQTFSVSNPPKITAVAATPQNGCAPLNSCFSSTVTSGTAPYSYLWDFCDGTSATTISPCHTYTTEGCYCYSLIVTDANGCVTDTTILPTDPGAICVTPPPVACFTSPNPSNCSAPWTVNFVNCSTGGTTAEWTFTGGTPSSSTANTPPPISYSSAGAFPVSLTVTSASGCQHTVTIPNFVNVGQATTTINAPSTSVCSGQTLEVTTSGANTYAWSASPAANASFSSTTVQNPTVTFTNTTCAPIQVTLTVNVTIPGGCSATDTEVIMVNPEPVASFTVQNSAGVVCSGPLSIEVTNTSQPSACTLTYNWLFPGTTSPSTGASTLADPGTLTYSACGVYGVSLVATAPGGCIDTFTIDSAAIINCATATVSIVGTSLPPIGQRCAPMDVTFQAVGSGNVYNWNFTNYNPSSPSFPQANLGPNPTWSYPGAGCYNVAVQVINTAAGCTAVAVLPAQFKLGSLAGAEPLDFSIDPPSACAAELVTLTIESDPLTPTILCCPLKYQVKWGDGLEVIGNGPTFTHEYADTAMVDCFDVTVIRSRCECADTLILEDVVCIFPPITKVQFSSTCLTPKCIIADASASIGVDYFDWSETVFPPGTIVTFSPGTAGSPSAGVDSAIATICFPDINQTYPVTVWGFNTAANCSMAFTGNAVTTFPDADFTLTPNPVCAPGVMNVQNQSTAVPVSAIASAQWKVWDATTNVLVTTSGFGGFSVGGATGTMGTSPATPPFNVPGCYNVQLRITSTAGCKDSILKGPFCAYGTVPNFSASPTQGCAPLTVNFTDLTPSTVNGAPESWEWFFGDDTSGNPQSTDENPTHTYTESGLYDVTLCVTSTTNGLTCENCTTKTEFITIGGATVDFYAIDTTVCAGTPVCFISAVTSAASSFTYLWDFGEAGTNDTSSLALPCHTYSANGLYSVTLTITDASGCVTTFTRDSYIDVGAIDADFTTADTTATACPPLLVDFINTTPGIDTTAGWSCLWFFGDNNISPPSPYCDPFHAYTIAGTFDVTLIITAPNGCTDTVTKDDYIFVGGPTANVVSDNTLFCAPGQICFDANPSNSISFLWCFGDGTSCEVGAASGPDYGTMCHDYNTAGVFYPKVLLCDGAGCCYELPIDTIVSDSASAHFAASAFDVCNGGMVDFNGDDSLFSFSNIVQYDFTVDEDGAITNYFDMQAFSHTFETTAEVTLTITTAGGCIDDTTMTVMVTPTPVLNSITNSPTLCPGDTVVFSTDVTSLSPIDTYAWTFAGGTPATSSEANPQIVYSTSGPKNITLVVTAVNGCSDSTTHTIDINPAPVANAGADKSACASESVVLDGSGGLTYEWLPGNTPGVPITDQNPSVLPPVTTTYTLTVFDVNGCADTDEAVVFVGFPPVPEISGPASACADVPAVITAGGGTNYEWSTGATTASITVTPGTTTTYNVTVIAANTCESDTFFQLNVLPLPVAAVIPDASVCINDTVQLSATVGGLGYQWSSGPGAVITSTPVAQDVEVVVTGSTGATITVVVTDPVTGCNNDTTHFIGSLPLPVAYAGPDIELCLGSDTVLPGSGGETYDWSDANGPISSDQNPVVSPTTTTDYTVVVTGANGCTASDAVTVNINQLPVPVIAAADSICANDSLQLTASLGVSFIWNTGASTNPAYDTPGASGSYSVTVTDAVGCTGEASHAVTVMPLPVANAVPDTAVCAGKPVQLGANAGFESYLWTPAAPLNDSALQNPLATIDDTTLFVVTVTDAFGCDNRDSVLVTMLPLPTVVAAPLSPNSCGGDPVLIIVTGGVSYVWTNDQYITAGMVPGYYTATVPDTTEFIVEGTDANGCVGTDTVILNVLFPFDVTLTSDTCLCFGDCGQLRAQASPGFIYTWSPTAFLDTPTIATPTTCATYDIQYQVIVFDGSCYADTAGVNVCVHPLPAVTAGNDTLIVAGTSAYLVASSDIGMGQYEWTPDSLVDCALCPVTMANPEYITTYVVSFTDDNGCRDADSVVVDVFCSNASIYIPNAFTPDSDNLNDFYMVHGAGFELKFLRIYNRWGEKVFETNDLAQGWDGKYKGVLYEPEVFVYYLEAVCSSGELLSKKGNITLIR